MYTPGFCECMMYGLDGYVQPHCDCINGWVVVISFGLSAQFWYIDRNDHKVTITINSGDAVVFNGSPALNIQHGVDSIIEGTWPNWLSMTNQDLINKRIILQTRQELRNLRLQRSI
eukprot:TRINITY_DN7038_c0_g1_i1.p1 TRINITY_DN7038_c0_g1~~TRINITY_DN7038_c0_g1_i1.p1  ORF type:complete len:116 (-),score=11.77 TRINITY_DN7038_c0_g1_i1:17-364(-)